jgi:hypothetical protein
MATVSLLSFNPIVNTAWYDVNGTHRPVFGIADAEAAEATRLELLADEEAKEAQREAKRQERQSAINAEAVAQAVAKAAATPHFTASLAFLKLINYKDTCPKFDEIFAEMKRLQAEADAAERGEEV